MIHCRLLSALQQLMAFAGPFRKQLLTLTYALTRSALRPLLAIVLTTLFFTHKAATANDDNLLAFQLYEQGEYARAGEIFTDPAWKGVALYRSAQWWRAAEAFVRANDAVSAYNLGNCYVKLGYYELALDAYLRALTIDSSLNDAEHNAEVMRQLLAKDDNDKQRGGRQSSAEEIDRVESDSKPEEQGQSEGGDEQSDTGKDAAGDIAEAGEQIRGPDENAQAGDGGESGSDQKAAANQDSGSGALDGERDDNENRERPSGGSDSDKLSDDSQAAGIRIALESEQATMQWLNRIQHDPQLFLQERIKLEQRRRLAAGQAAPAGGSTW